MKKCSFLLLIVATLALFNLSSQGHGYPLVYKTDESSNAEKTPWLIKGVQSFSENTGIIFTEDSIFITSDAGETWQEIEVQKNNDEIISNVLLTNDNEIWVILTNHRGLWLLKSTDNGESWNRFSIRLRFSDLQEAGLDKVSLEKYDAHVAELRLRLPSTSNFFRVAVYRTFDAGESWYFQNSYSEIRKEDAIEESDSPWLLVSDGSCMAFKRECFQETKLFIRGREVTPAALRDLLEAEKIKAQLRLENSILVLNSPGGSVRTSINRGFDKCAAASVSQMQTWWDFSPFYDANIYISGRNRGCSQTQLSASWVQQVSAMGWGLIPTVVGYQAPCSSCTNCAKHSSDPVVAEQQGRSEADIAITDANNLGLTQGTVLYYDMERYDETSTTPGCRNAVKAFLKGWTDRLKELGYISGVYGSPTNAVNDWIDIPTPSRMDAVWLARWDNIASVWIYAAPSPQVPANVWNNRQRIKQYQAPHNETWGGVTFNIDGNIAEGPVAGIAAPKNKPADFDGDGKTDISIFRPSDGNWYILQSSTQNLRVMNFGTSSDIPVPADYDGNGKTDFAVFRPSESTWYIQNRIFRTQQFGTSTDVAVPADYNGDGFADIAVFRSGIWYILNSSGSPNPLRVEQFGTSGDKAVSADYDGDGKTDLAVFRDGVWYLLRSQLGFTAIQFGLPGDKPVPGDYDGDGLADIAVFRDGTWYLLRSQLGFTGIQFGISSDKPVPGDYDGDGKTDIAVFRGGIWYILQSTNGFTAISFGMQDDNPIPSFYLPQN